MLKHISLFSKRLLRMTLIEIVFFIALFTGLAMMTLLCAVLMLMRWHAGPGVVMLVCLLPWLVLLIALAIGWVIYNRRVKKSKEDVFGFKLGELLFSAAPVLVSYLFSKAKRKR